MLTREISPRAMGLPIPIPLCGLCGRGVVTKQLSERTLLLSHDHYMRDEGVVRAERLEPSLAQRCQITTFVEYNLLDLK